MKHAFLPVILFLASCATSSVRVDQTISLDNSGHKTVRNFQLHYGRYDFPKRPLSEFDHGGGGTYHVAIPIPNSVSVTWISGKDISHNETVDILSATKQRPWMSGYRKLIFDVDDEVLRVFLVKELPNFREESVQIK